MDSADPPARRAVASDDAPAALGPYSQAIIAGGFVFCSGTAGIDPASGQILEGIEAQTEQALENNAAILHAAMGRYVNAGRMTDGRPRPSRRPPG